LPPILDQGNIGSCVANAFAFCIAVQTKNALKISRLYHYANCRILDSTPLKQDNGTTIQTACAAIKNYGAASELSYPYNISVFSKFPPLTIYQGAKWFKTFSYVFVSQNLASIKNCLNTYKVPIIFGFFVYSSFMTNTVSKTGIVPIPNTTIERRLGGHCMIIVGYNDTTQMFTCANSWGTSWGNKGYCYIPYNYLLNSKLAMDFCFTQFVF
jgi:C1A family cysteine protease